MRFRMLGPLEVWSEDGWTGIGAAKWRSLLACLLLKPGQIVPTETLIAELWGETPPSTANNLVSIYVHRLRRIINDAEGKILAHRKPGYQLRAGDDTDLRLFETMVGDARRLLAQGDADRAASVLREAENLWRGDLLADVAPTLLVSTESARAGELRLAATELRIGADLACGRHSDVVPDLRSLVADTPLREGLWLLLMRALDGAGRRAEALETYGQAREAIADELGVDPGPELRRLHAELLAADASPPAPERRIPPAPPAAAVPGPVPRPETAGSASDAREKAPERAVPGAMSPAALGEGGGEETAVPAQAGPADPPPLPRLAQLPADITDFTGRVNEVAHLNAMLTRHEKASGPGAVRTAVVAGTAGLGKTTLAVHAAHQVGARFPDGQLYVDLAGASAQPSPPGEVLARFLRDLGVDGDKIPAGNDERAALYRTKLTGRQVLILLDNARDAAQIRLLLPGTSSCAVLVTTRNRALSLATSRFLDLDTLPDPEALELFIRLVGDERPATEPDATAEVLLACAGLPLAIRICAARLAARRQWKVATMATRLRDSRRRLDELQAGDLEVRASFQVSYDALRAVRRRVDPARAFRLLGLWQGQAISLPAAAALIGEEEGDAARVLEGLVDANLLESAAPDWYRLHDLLRVYATERAEEEEPGDHRAAAVARLLRWYAGTAESAADLVSPHRYRIEAEAGDSAPGAPLTSVEEAVDWYESERGNVITAARQAAASGLHDLAWRLPTTLFPLFNRRDNWTDCMTAHRIAMASAREAGHLGAEAWSLQNLGQSLSRLRDTEALGYLSRALDIRRDTGDRLGEAQTAISLVDAHYKLQGAEVAFEHSLRCLEILREVGYESFLGIGLNNHGEYCLELGRLKEAAECFEETLEIWRALGAYGQGHALHNLGRVYLRSGQVAEAIGSLTEAHRLHMASGDLVGQATALKFLGFAQRDSGRANEARQSWSAALVIFEDLKADAEVEAIRTALAA